MTKGIQVICNDFIYFNFLEKWAKQLDAMGISSNEKGCDNTISVDSVIALNEHTTKHEVDIFLGEIIFFNNHDYEPSGFILTEDPKSSLENLLAYFKNNSEAIVDPVGGLMFFEGDKKIIPGCCCSVEDGIEAIEDISNKKSTWLGHDPFPRVEYKEGYITVWDDDCLGEYVDKPISKEQLISIDFSETELSIFLPQAKKDVELFFLKPFKQRITEFNADIADELTNAIIKWLGIK